MAQTRKYCLYKGCDNVPGRTLFRFPIEKERFTVWAQNAGLNLKGDVNLTEYRYLCENHFSKKYISNQSRRKMLVHTAVPEKWNENVSNSETEFTLVGQPAEKKRKPQYPSRESFDALTTPQPTVILNNQKRKLNESTSASEDALDMLESESGGQTNMVYEEVIIPPNKRSYKCVFVKQKQEKSPPKTIINYIQPASAHDDSKEETFFLTEEGNISSTNTDQKEPGIEDEGEQTAIEYKKPAAVENYSEFIFSGEIYVQMPKRVFEAEKEKIRAENSAYRAILLKLRKQIDDLLEN